MGRIDVTSDFAAHACDLRNKRDKIYICTYTYPCTKWVTKSIIVLEIKIYNNLLA